MKTRGGFWNDLASESEITKSGRRIHRSRSYRRARRDSSRKKWMSRAKKTALAAAALGLGYYGFKNRDAIGTGYNNALSGLNQGYADAKTLARRIEKVEAWLADPQLLEADKDAEYAHVIEIDLADIKEPIVCCPNDPDDAKFLSEVAGTKIDEAFIGSCMTNIGHFRAAAKVLGTQRDIPVKLWVAPPTKMDESELIKEGHYATFGSAGARTEMPGCSLCMGNQAQVREGATVVSTSTRNFPNRLGKNTNVFLVSAELAAVCSKLGRIPTVAEYMEAVGVLNKDSANIYKYLNFDQIEEYVENAKETAA